MLTIKIGPNPGMAQGIKEGLIMKTWLLLLTLLVSTASSPAWAVNCWQYFCTDKQLASWLLKGVSVGSDQEKYLSLYSLTPNQQFQLNALVLNRASTLATTGATEVARYEYETDPVLAGVPPFPKEAVYWVAVEMAENCTGDAAFVVNYWNWNFWQFGEHFDSAQQVYVNTLLNACP